MIIRTLEDTVGSDLDIEAPTWRSRRLILARDGMGFSVHDTIIEAGTETPMWYRNHLEAVYCIEGEGTLEDVATGEIHKIEPGMLYALDQHDKHVVRATSRLRLVCVFNPPCTGAENHDEHGGYPLLVDDSSSGSPAEGASAGDPA